MDRRKFLLVLLTVAALVALGVWSYSSAPSSSTPRAAAAGSPRSAKSGTTPGRTKKTATSSTRPAPTTTVAPNPQSYSKALFGYWQQHDRISAAKVANAVVVKELFARPFRVVDGWVVQACHGAAASTTCTWTSPRRQFVFQIRGRDRRSPDPSRRDADPALSSIGDSSHAAVERALDDGAGAAGDPAVLVAQARLRPVDEPEHAAERLGVLAAHGQRVAGRVRKEVQRVASPFAEPVRVAQAVGVVGIE